MNDLATNESGCRGFLLNAHDKATNKLLKTTLFAITLKTASRN